jgi:carbon storage regulator CsrA
MLILSRRSCESVVVGDPAAHVDQLLKVTVLEIGRGRLRLGFEGADKFPVNRWEVWQRIRAGYQPEGPPNEPPPLIAQ